jgi:RimJ/RimL family protein N-acetyltransferase
VDVHGSLEARRVRKRGPGAGFLTEAMLDLADNWPNLTRIELCVYTDNAAVVGIEVE